MKKAIINVSSNNNWYAKGQKRLRESMPNEVVFTMLGEDKIGAPAHSVVPYGFKPYALEWLRQRGYELVLWLDASFWAVKPLDTIWEHIKINGHLMEESGHYLNQWCNDRALKNLGLTREEAKLIPMYSAGMTGLNLNIPRSAQFLDEWLAYAKDGETFCGDKSNHRHDMSVASALANKYEMKYNTGGTYMAYIGKVYGEPKETAVFHLAGM